MVRRSLDRLIDLGPPVVIAGLGIAEMAGLSFGSVFPGPRPVEVAFLLAGSLPLALRRRWPLAVLICVGLANATWLAVLFPTRQPQPPVEAFLAMMLAAYAAGAHGRGRSFWIALALIAAVIVADTVAGGGLAADLVVDVFVAAVFAVGDAVRRQRDLSRALRETVARLEVEREQRARIAVELERTRIARELHDVVAHAISVMVVQAGAERRMLGALDERTIEVLQTIERVGREALAETRTILGVLRQDGSEPPLAPPPGLDDLPDLLERFQTTGLEVDFETDSEAATLRPLSAGFQLTAYRIIQEGLTNVLKHAPGAKARVSLCFEGDGLAITVRDDGHTAPATKSPAGHGLGGIRERVAIHGGWFTAGPAETGGFVLRAKLPFQTN
jgi:signal transduction histidine kinase